MDAQVDIPKTVGALLAGGLVATAFTGVINVQSYNYYKSYRGDAMRVRLLVAFVCTEDWLIDTPPLHHRLLDFCHTLFVSLSLWHYLVLHYGDTSMVDSVPWSLAMTIAFTAILTFLVHCFFVHRIFKLSVRKWIIAVPLAALAFSRLCFACLTTYQLIKLDSLDIFTHRFHWSFTLGLALSSILDILITGSLCYYLSNSRNPSSSLNLVIDVLILYAFENGALTTAATIVSMICWLIMPHNRIFMGLHFIISKFYANSLLATLNTRKRLRGTTGRTDSNSHAIPVVLTEDFTSQPRGNIFSRVAQTLGTKRRSASPMVHINVQQTVECTIDEDEMMPAKVDSKVDRDRDRDVESA
ncbi:hypothetical protein BDN71DRAFT_1502093 [Pleurotus eryngii]|uniref:DUF6534 domain-containing protein n=1 Tax=Pleurotus eryngii TaxID=5323 RepID=A0A9P6A7I1_PLEER|nr:hypothetical protein BDN71DRAFT_1502093 [Pleurotus eryngii]